MSIQNSKLMNLADGKVLYDDLRQRVENKEDKAGLTITFSFETDSESGRKIFVASNSPSDVIAAIAANKSIVAYIKHEDYIERKYILTEKRDLTIMHYDATQSTVSFSGVIMLDGVGYDITITGSSTKWWNYTTTEKLDAPTTAGTSGQVLTINSSGTPVWATPPAGGAMIDDTAGAGDTNVTFSADKLTTMDSALKSAIDEKEDTPVVVIFTISQNAGVYTVTANKTPNELYAEYKAGAKIRAYQVSTNTGSIIDMACNVQESTDFYQFRFSSVESRLLCGYDGYIMGIKDGNWEYHNYEIMVASDINSEFYANTRRIASLGDPVNDYDAATKNYVDTHAVAVPDLEITFSVETDSDTGASKTIIDGATWAEFVAAWTAGKTISATFQAGAIAELTSIYYDSTSGTAFFTGAIGSSVKPQSVLVVWGANTLDYTIESGGISDVRINDSSVVTNGVANIPVASSSSFGTIKVMDNAAGGLGMTAQGYLCFSGANESQIKAGTTPNLAPPVSRQHMAVFYGLAKAAGDTTQASSSNTVGTYTSEAKAAIQTMLGIDMPTKTSDLTNDSYFVSASFNDDELVLATAATWAEGVSF